MAAVKNAMQKSQWFLTLKLLSKTDLIMICLILLSGVLSFLYTLSSKSQKHHVLIYHNNIVIRTENLNQNLTIPIDSLLIIEIANGKARIVHSSCKNLVCERIGWSNSKPIICVPNKVFLEFSKKEEEDLFITR